MEACAGTEASAATAATACAAAWWAEHKAALAECPDTCPLK